MADRSPKTGTALLPSFDAPAAPSADAPPWQAQPNQQIQPASPQYVQPAAPQYPQYAPQYPQYQQQQQQQYATQPAQPLKCPECGEMTMSLKQYNYMRYLVFVWFFAFWNVKKGLACPSCMRNDLLIKILMNLVLANILWPFLILPWNTVLFVCTFLEGHSMGADNALRQHATGGE